MRLGKMGCGVWAATTSGVINAWGSGVVKESAYVLKDPKVSVVSEQQIALEQILIQRINARSNVSIRHLPIACDMRDASLGTLAGSRSSRRNL